MAGSQKWFTYQDDNGTDWAYFGDESNIEGANGQGQNGAPPNQELKPPRNMRVRYAVYGNQDGTRALRVPIMTQNIYNALNAADTIPDQLNAVPGSNLSLIRKRPEVISPIPTAFDTGNTDGDN